MRQPANFTVNIRGSSRGLPDRKFRIRVCEEKGITVRLDGSSNARTLTWRQFLAQVLLHYGDLT